MKKLLQIISNSPLLEAQWLNTLSLLEYIGSRKISKTVCLSHPSLETLKHFADETRHSFTFKKLSQLLSEGHCEEYLCGDEAASYFQMLDKTISEYVVELTGRDDPYQNYLFVTAMIERRAMKIYPVYRVVTQNVQVCDELQHIIVEEVGHKDTIEDQAENILKKHRKTFKDLDDIEEQFFNAFCQALKRNLATVH